MHTSVLFLVWALLGLASLLFVLASPQSVTPAPPQAIKRHVLTGPGRRRKTGAAINNPLIASLQVKADALRKPKKAKRACPSNLPNGGCACPGDTIYCNGDCINIYGEDGDNCGACGYVCPLYALCTSGVCGCDEANGFEPCNGGCYDANYGSGQTCCENSLGLYDCYNNGDCVDVVGQDVNNCGSCGHACPQYALCSAGVCGCDEANNFFPCNDGCYDANYGSGQVCCENSLGMYDCLDDNVCVDVLDSDVNNCGSCGYVCPEYALCSGGVCGCDEANNFFPCNDGCYDANYGSGQVCCENSAGLYDCANNNVCVYVDGSDSDNCGSCGKVCPEYALCSGGTCSCDEANGFLPCPDGTCYDSNDPGSSCPA